MTMSPEEIDDIRRRLAALPDPDLTDPDNPKWADEDFARAFHFDPPLKLSEVSTAEFRKLMGRPKSAAPKHPVKLRIDPDVLAAYRAEGPGWQTRMNATLRKGMPKPAKRTA